MRIACISASQVPSRAANSIQVMKVCQALIDLGHEISLWVPGNTPEEDWDTLLAHYGLRDTFPIHWLTAPLRLRRYDFALRAVQQAHYWEAELFYVWPYQVAALASNLGRPTVLEMHDRPMGRLGPTLFRAFLKGSGALRILPTTRVLAGMLEEQFQTTFPPGFVSISPNGVDLSRYADFPSAQKLRAELGLRESLTVGYTGHLYAGRGMEMVVALAGRNPDVEFLVAGGEPNDVDRWQAVIAAENIRNVFLLGFVPNQRLPGIQGACDILIMPHARQVRDSSGTDIAAVTNPMKSFEYLAAGRAIMASDLPILHEVLHDGNAVFLPPEDVDNWDAALKALLKDPERREALGRRAKEDARQYTWLERERRALEDLL